MSTCRICGTGFHHCSSCGDDGYSEHDLCSETCKEAYIAKHQAQLEAAKAALLPYRDLVKQIYEDSVLRTVLENWIEYGGT